MEQSLWSHLPLLVRSNSKDSVEYILQALWRTRKTGLDSADRQIVRDMLQLENDSDLDSVHLTNPSFSYSNINTFTPKLQQSSLRPSVLRRFDTKIDDLCFVRNFIHRKRRSLVCSNLFSSESDDLWFVLGSFWCVFGA